MPGKSRGCAFARFTFILWICELPQWFIDYINWYAKQEKERMRKMKREPFNFYCARVQKNVFRKTLCRNKMAKVLQIIFEKDISFYRYNAQTNATTTKSKKNEAEILFHCTSLKSTTIIIISEMSSHLFRWLILTRESESENDGGKNFYAQMDSQGNSIKKYHYEHTNRYRLHTSQMKCISSRFQSEAIEAKGGGGCNICFIQWKYLNWNIQASGLPKLDIEWSFYPHFRYWA